MVTLQIDRLSKTYTGRVPVEALREVSVRIGQGEYVAIQGPSGSGKSTLLNQIALLDTPTEGTYSIDGVSTGGMSDAARARLRSATFAFIFQSFHLLEDRTVLDNVALGTLYRALTETRRKELAREALGFVGLEHKAEQKAANLSGGERQRVAIARAIASGAPVVVADEPTGNLDTQNGAAVMDTLEKLNQSGATVIIVTHDPVIASRATRKLQVLDGTVTDQTLTNNTEVVSVSPSPQGRDSRVRLLDALKDTWKGLWAKPSRTLALVGSVALGVALALTTTGLSQTSQYQVSDIFDAQRNQRVGMTSGTLDSTAGQTLTPTYMQAVSVESLERVRGIAGVESAAVFITHDEIAVSVSPNTPIDRQLRGTVIGMVDGSIPASLFTIDTQGAVIEKLSDGDVVIGAQLAQELDLGPLLASPSVWIMGQPRRVVGILTDSGLQIGLLNSVITTETAAALISPSRYGTAEIRVAPGAAAQVATQAPVAWTPATPETVQVDAPPDPATLRAEIESNLATMLLTLTGVALLASVLSLTNSMTTAVFQRTGEFGLRRAIGARRIHITSLVLTESLAIGLLGGIIGAYISVLAILTITIIRQWQPVIDPSAIPLGIAGGIIVGLLGGIIATRRASHIQPSDALRA